MDGNGHVCTAGRGQELHGEEGTLTQLALVAAGSISWEPDANTRLEFQPNSGQIARFCPC